MVLDKFKDFVKGEEEGKNKKFSKERPESKPTGRDMGRKNPSRKRQKSPLQKKSPDRTGRNQGKGDLSLPSERDTEDLPKLPGSSEERNPAGPGNRRSSGSQRSGRSGGGPSKRTTPGTRRNERPTEGRRTSPERPGAGGERETLSQSEVMERILEKLDDIDRKLDRLQDRR